MIIRGVVNCRVTIDGQDATDLGIIVDAAAQRQHLWYYVPTLDIRILDLKGYFPGGIPDGQQFSIAMGLDQDPSSPALPQARTYRKFKASQTAGNEYNTYTISAHYDAGHHYLMDRISKAYKGSASDVISAALTEVGITASLVSTADTQVWRAHNQTRAEFARRVVLPYAYSGDNACLMMAYSSVSDRVIMADLMQVVTRAPKYRITNYAAPDADYYAIQSGYTTDSGLMNKLGGYGQQTRARVLGSDQTRTFDQVQVNKSQRALNISDQLLTTSSIQVPTLDIGNRHPNCHQARHQNSRIGGTFTNWLDVLVRQTTQIDLFDVVQVSLRTAAGAAMPASGQYICVGRATAATHREYAEKLVLVSNSVNSAGGLVA